MHFPSPRTLLKLSAAAAVTTIVLKTLAWYVTGSVGLLSDAMESFVNLAGALFALMMVSLAEQPADAGHPHGHNKAEYFSSGFEGMLIFGAALGILWTSVDRLLHPAELERLDWGMAFSVASTVLNGVGAWVLIKASRVHQSIALEADGRHLRTDVYTSIGVIAGVLMVEVTGWLWLDPLVAMGVALNILREGWELMRRSIDGLMDRALSDAEVAAIERTLAEASPPGCFHGKLTTRAAGALHFAQIELCVPGEWTVAEAHAVADALERIVLERTDTRLATHLEPITPTAPSGAEADLT